jgi:hypothetical protein
VTTPPPPAPAPPRRRRGFRLLVGLLVGLPLLALGGSGYYAARGPRLCGDCHEIQPSVALWQSSTHRGVGCDACHGGILTPQIEFHLGNLRRVGVHLAGKLPERIRITDQQVDALVERCVRCHQQEAAEWSAGPHGTTYRRIFLDASHNRRRLLMDDCLRCHGMYFEGPIRDLVAPLDTVGPWRLEPEGMGTRHAIPCMACHQIHREGMPLGMLPARAESAPGDRERFRPSLALYDRRGQRDVPADLLPLPAMRDHGRPVAASPDPRQALCYQCHAPQARRPDRDRRARGDQLPLVPLEPSSGHPGLVRGMSPGLLQLRPRRRGDGHHLQEPEEPSRHPLRGVPRLSRRSGAAPPVTRHRQRLRPRRHPESFFEAVPRKDLVRVPDSSGARRPAPSE